VRVRRARAATVASRARRVGYGLFLLAGVVVVVGLATRFTAPVAATATACLVLGSLTLAPAIVVGYGVRAAEREDRALCDHARGTTKGDQ
jgi:hypothetical protein